MTRKKLAQYRLSPILRALGACAESLAWIEREKHPTFAAAIASCDRVDWLLWLAGRTISHRAIVAIACDLATPALDHTTDPRPAACVAKVRAWLRGDAAIDQVREARRAASAAAYSAASTAAAYSAYSASAAANAADVASAASAANAASASAASASAANAAAYSAAAYAAAASASASAAADAAADAAREKANARSLEIVRSAIDWGAVERRLVEIGRERGALVEIGR